MKTFFLFPHAWKKVGWILLLPFLVLGILSIHQEFEFGWLDFDMERSYGFFRSEVENFTNELAAIGALVALGLIGFSKLRFEDEYTLKIRLDSLLISIYTHYVLVFLAILFLYSEDFFIVMIYNLYTPLILFILVFHYKIMRNDKLN